MTIALPAAAAVVALVGAGIAVTGSDSAEANEAPRISSQPPKPAEPSKSELSKRVVDAMKADTKSERSLVKQPDGAEASSAPSARIIGGQETTISTAPWMAQLHFKDSTGAGYFCGGAVIAPTKVATAAHCVKGIKWYQTGVVVVGTDQLPTDTGQKDADGAPVLDYHGGQTRIAYRQWNHPAYSPYTLDADVAVLTLASPVSVKPLPLAQPTDSALYQAGRDGKVYGWGRTSSTNPDSASQTLKVADADIVSDTNCAAAYPDGFIKGHMLCAGAAPTGSDETSETTCNGDSGGPLVVGGKLVGIVSWGDADCSAAGKYGVYAKVSTYSAPIQARVDDTNWSGDDHTADLLARRASDNTLFGWVSRVTSLYRKFNHGNWAGITMQVQGDLNRDDYQDLLFRMPNGDVYLGYSDTADPKLVAKAWGKHKAILLPGDVTGDELPDMIAVDSTGTMRIYPGKGTGAFAAPVAVGTAWGSFTMIRGHGDFTNDGKADIFARAKDGKTYLYKGTGVATKPWAAPVLVGAFGTMNALITTGDVNSDGVADVMTRDTAGKLWLYPGNGKGGFLARKDFGSGWQAYNLFG
ncbi:trypsin-like serine protease [Streptomyces ficellus]|uniref:Trypsin-like serine protease n=1 Tax=Streptomyces ficellus TaxID=1977088 RepID=A0ABT7Z4Y6_9ACTN|nr:trypsin-like serine protease [Streptomyces ficellus]MDN3294496.1 trypsin-like serine protease [Streptomyces ficellus]